MNLVAVGAANIGSIFLDFDRKLKTNRLRDIAVHCGGDISEPWASLHGLSLLASMLKS